MLGRKIWPFWSPSKQTKTMPLLLNLLPFYSLASTIYKIITHILNWYSEIFKFHTSSSPYCKISNIFISPSRKVSKIFISPSHKVSNIFISLHAKFQKMAYNEHDSNLKKLKINQDGIKVNHMYFAAKFRAS